MKQLRLNAFLRETTENTKENRSTVVNLPAEIKSRLVTLLEEWAGNNADVIGEKWKKRIYEEIRKFKSKKPTIPTVAGFAMWTFCTINNLGVISAIGQDGFVVSDSTWKNGFDEGTTKRLLLWVSEAIKLMQIPKETAKQLGWD